MTKFILAMVAVLMLAGSAVAAPGKDSPSDANNGGGNDPPSNTGATNQPGPGNS